MKQVKKVALVLAGTMFLTSVILVRADPIWFHEYRVCDLVSGSAVDQDGRVGRLYSAGSNLFVVVIFNKNYHPRHGGWLDRIFTPPPSTADIGTELAFDTKTLRCGTAPSDEVFNNFMRKRSKGTGWNDGGIIAQVKSTGGNKQYILTEGDSEVITIRLGAI